MQGRTITPGIKGGGGRPIGAKDGRGYRGASSYPPWAPKAPRTTRSSCVHFRGYDSKSASDIFKEWDRDGNGLIDFEEFQAALKWIKQQNEGTLTQQEADLAKREAKLSLYKEDLASSVEVRF